MISIILGSGDLPSNLSATVSTNSIFRVPLAPGAAIEKVILREAELAERIFVTYSDKNPPTRWLRSVSPMVEWVNVPENAQMRSIGASVLMALEAFFSGPDSKNEEVRIVYGDTLTSVEGTDLVAVGHTAEPEDWSYAPSNLSLMPINSRASESEPKIIAGLFCFEDGKLFYDLLKEAAGPTFPKRGAEPFYKAIQSYASIHPASLRFQLDSEWQDFGHLNTYMSTRKGSLEGRQVNSFGASEQGLFVTKNSSRIQKLQNEARWFREVPDELFRFLPRVVLPPNLENYQVQYIRAITLSEKVLYGETGQIDWKFIFDSLENWLNDASAFQGEGEEDLEPIWFQSSFSARQSEILSNSKLDARIAAEMATKGEILSNAIEEVSVRMQQEPLCVVHGDLILSNILVSERDRTFKLIDPRGGFSRASIYGPPIYEWAKIAQSIYGRYEEILAAEYLWQDNREGSEIVFFEDRERNSNYQKMQDWFESRCPYPSVAKKLSGLLLISAIPFHFEDPKRVLAMFHMGIRLIEVS